MTPAAAVVDSQDAFRVLTEHIAGMLRREYAAFDDIVMDSYVAADMAALAVRVVMDDGWRLVWAEPSLHGVLPLGQRLAADREHDPRYAEIFRPIRRAFGGAR